jgi:hypothetical protein
MKFILSMPAAFRWRPLVQSGCYGANAQVKMEADVAWILSGDSPDTPIEVPEGTPGSIPGPMPGTATDYTAWLATYLSNYETLARTLVKHAAEKGRIVESVVKSALRGILPGRFSIGTGFAITASGRTSPQLDLVIYDGYLNSPIILEGGTGLFPIECVYGFVEVKSKLDGQEIDKFTKTVKSVRDLADEKRFVAYATRENEEGKEVAHEVELEGAAPPRSFMFAINSAYSDILNVESALKESAEKNGAHVHGLAVLDKDWFFHQVATFGKKPYEFVRRDNQSLANFCGSVLSSIQSMSMHPASMEALSWRRLDWREALNQKNALA